MTEAEWLACADAADLIRHLETLGALSERKLRLFGVACCQRVRAVFTRDERCRRAVEAAEQFADAPRDPAALSRLSGEADDASSEAKMAGRTDVEGAANAACFLCCPALTVGLALAVLRETRATISAGEPLPSRPGARRRLPFHNAPAIRCDFPVLVRDIFPNRPVPFDPARRTPTVTTLARTMYDSREFSAMPVLADALQDAGCDNADVLDHCRGPGPHVRGCWAADLVLGKG